MNNLFIVGVGRSGTSLLQSMMDSHSRISFLPETQFVRTYLRNSEGGSLIDKGEIERVISQGKIAERIPDSRIEASLEKLDERSTFKTFYEQLLKANGESAELSYYGDKDPRLLDYIETIARNFPKARVLHIYRDPRDIVLSKIKADWSKSRSYWMHAIIGQAQITNGRKKGKEYFGDNFIELQYEELINYPERTLKQICEKLEIEFEDQMLEYQNSSKRLVSTNELQWKKETFKPLIKENVEKWRRELSGFKIWVIENLSPTWFGSLNYKRSEMGLLSWAFRPVTFFLSLLYRSRL